jgi:hypothetical protein
VVRRQVRALIDGIGGLDDLIRHRPRVAIKVNLTGGTNSQSLPGVTPIESFVTHPEVVRALGEALLDRHRLRELFSVVAVAHGLGGIEGQAVVGTFGHGERLWTWRNAGRFRNSAVLCSTEAGRTVGFVVAPVAAAARRSGRRQAVEVRLQPDLALGVGEAGLVVGLELGVAGAAVAGAGGVGAHRILLDLVGVAGALGGCARALRLDGVRARRIGIGHDVSGRREPEDIPPPRTSTRNVGQASRANNRRWTGLFDDAALVRTQLARSGEPGSGSLRLPRSGEESGGCARVPDPGRGWRW